MDRFNALGRGAQVMLVAGVLLFLDLFLNWQEIEVDLGPLGEASSGVNAWDDFLGVLLGLLTIVLLAWLVVRLMAVDIPLPVSQAMTAAVLAVLIFFFALVKNLTDDYSTLWSYVGVALAGAILVGAYLAVQEAGGFDQLRSEIPSTGATTTTAAGGHSEPASPAAATPVTPSGEVVTPPPAVVEPREAPPETEAPADDVPPTTARPEPIDEPDRPGDRPA